MCVLCSTEKRQKTGQSTDKVQREREREREREKSPAVGMDLVFVVCFVGSGLCDELITRPENSKCV